MLNESRQIDREKSGEKYKGNFSAEIRVTDEEWSRPAGAGGCQVAGLHLPSEEFAVTRERTIELLCTHMQPLIIEDMNARSVFMCCAYKCGGDI